MDLYLEYFARYALAEDSIRPRVSNSFGGSDTYATPGARKLSAGATLSCKNQALVLKRNSSILAFKSRPSLNSWGGSGCRMEVTNNPPPRTETAYSLLVFRSHISIGSFNTRPLYLDRQLARYPVKLCISYRSSSRFISVQGFTNKCVPLHGGAKCTCTCSLEHLGIIVNVMILVYAFSCISCAPDAEYMYMKAPRRLHVI